MRLSNAGRTVLIIQALLLGGLGVAGLEAAGLSSTRLTTILGFSLNTPHSVLLLATAVGSAVAAAWLRVARLWSLIEATAFTLIFVIGAAGSRGGAAHSWLGLNAPDHFLHLGLAILAGVLATTLLSRPAILAETDESRGEHSRPLPRDEETDETRAMVQAEMAVAEGHPTPEQARWVHDDAEQRARTRRARAWQSYLR